MQIVEVKYDEFFEFAKNNSQFNVLQTIEHAKRRKLKYQFLALKNNDNKILGAGLYFYRNVILGFNEVDCQMGPILDYQDESLINKYFSLLIEYLKTQRTFHLLINPNVIRIERNTHAEIVENGINNENVIRSLQRLGFQEVNIENHPYFLKWFYTKDLTDIKDEEDLFASYTKKTRSTIKSALQNFIELHEVTRDELPSFKEIVDVAAENHGFKNRDMQHYYDLYDYFVENNKGKFIMARINTDRYNSGFNQKIENEKALLDLTSEDTKKNIGIRKEALTRLKSYQSKVDLIRDLESNNGYINLAAAMFFINESEIIYYNSGMINETRRLDAPYIIQHEALKYAISQGINRYNFYGTNGEFNNKPRQQGVYEFKKGFNGAIEELVGYFEYPVNPLINTIVQFQRNMRDKIKG